ncbi:MAG: hypothetical protein OQJ93_10035 [Ignavibacteriaceae bacterium]|jgi:hypothetical protein|nr:hypothetical protein [Chlorobium sp.]MCW8824261.1 hypothetical protein [Ignavibacteriaceae bacterium]MCW9095741.1 hypothetical protein [Ignavibacteriaceae bacterium]MCW9097716.1 hypothetical protein [Ignavibacteriaceae bacterium]
MRRVIISVLVITLGLLLRACNTTEPPIQNGASISIKLFDISVTEAYLYIEINNSSSRQVELLKDDTMNLSFNLAGNDTILLISDLTEETNYKFTALLKYQDYIVSRTEELSVTTLTPTSSNFNWQVFSFGNPNYGNSVLRDVSIINENYIWVVGEVYQLDSLGQTDTQVYGAGYWNGSEWKFMKVPLRDYGEPRPEPTPFNLKTIFNLGSEIYAATSAHIIKYENNKWIEKYFLMKDLNFNGQVLQMYAYNEDNIFCVGRNGTIYHITNSGWNEIESGTETYLSDIWGTIQPIDGEQIKYITGLHLQPQDETKLLKMNDQNIVQDLNWNENSDLSSVWSNKSFPIYVGGNQLFTNKTGDWVQIPDILFQYYITCIRGSALNDIVVCGTLGFLVHFNGIDWITYDQVAPGAIFSSIEIKGNTICAVGEMGRDAIIVLGKRVNSK